MKRFLSISIFLVLPYLSFGQDIISWSADYKLTLEDFQSPETEINENLNSYSIYSATNVDFGYQMSTAQFMFTKNFNSKVSTTFNKKSAVITSPDSINAKLLVNFAQYSFDLSELYARKLRKKIYEEKGAFSSPNFFEPIYQQNQQEMTAELARVQKLTNLGHNEDLLQQEREKVLNDINNLSDFCKECKPPKRK